MSSYWMVFSGTEWRRSDGNSKHDHLQRHTCHRNADVSGAESVVRQKTWRHAQQNGEARSEASSQIDEAECREATCRHAVVSNVAEGSRRATKDEPRRQGRAVKVRVTKRSHENEQHLTILEFKVTVSKVNITDRRSRPSSMTALRFSSATSLDLRISQLEAVQWKLLTCWTRCTGMLKYYHYILLNIANLCFHLNQLLR